MRTTIRTKLLPTDSGLVNTDFLEDLIFDVYVKFMALGC